MRKKYTEAVELVSSRLLQGTQDPGQWREIFRRHLGIGKEGFQKSFAGIVLQVNNEIFPPVEKMELMLTRRCNLACKYCFESGYSRTAGPADMPEEIIREAIDLFAEYSRESKELFLTFFGGEPLLNFKGIKQATEYAGRKLGGAGKKVAFDTTSNGVLLTPEIMDYFSEHGINVLLSIDGLRPTHDKYRTTADGRGSYDAVIGNLALLKQRQPWIGAKMTVMPSSVPFLEDNVRRLYDLGVNQFLIGYATGEAWEERQILAYKRQIWRLWKWYKAGKRKDLRISEAERDGSGKKYYGCRSGRNTVAVAADGMVSGCSRILTLGEMPPAGILGDTRYGLYGISNRLQMVSCRTLKENCVSAGLAETYRGGCFAVNFEENRDLYKPSIVNHEFSRGPDAAFGQGG